jgi:transcriptional regulator GlxA family with amidase domain
MESAVHDRPGHPGATASRLEAVERAEAYVRTHTGGSVPVSTLCRVVGLSERGLRNAFYGVRGMSPKRYLTAARLRAARRALRNARGGDTTVTGVATRYGFYELGRFAASYKEAFGETPSATLRGTTRRWTVEHPRNTREQGNAYSQ